MGYDEILASCKSLSYRDKLRLAQYLIQQARKEEEIENPQQRTGEKAHTKSSTSANAQTPQERPEQTIEYVIERLQKLKPSKRSTLINSMTAMFQFQGGISDADKEKIVKELQKRKHITINANNTVTYHLHTLE